MRLYAIVGGLLALSGLLLAARLTQGCCGTTGCATPVVTCCPIPAGPGRPVAELAAILDKTQSKDTFLLGVMTLRSMGPEAKEALPAILRNAERLGLLGGIADGLCRKGKASEAAVSGATEEIRGAMLDIAACARDQNNPAPLATGGPIPQPQSPLLQYSR